MNFRELLESKKVTGVKGMLRSGDDFNGSLKTTISVMNDPDEEAVYTSLNLSGRTWELKSVNIPDGWSASNFKKETKKAIENILDKQYQTYFYEEDQVWYAEDKEIDIELSKTVLK